MDSSWTEVHVENAMKPAVLNFTLESGEEVRTSSASVTPGNFLGVFILSSGSVIYSLFLMYF